MADIHPDTDVEKVDIERMASTTENLFGEVHGRQLMQQASTKVDELTRTVQNKKDSVTSNKGLEIATNARLSKFEAEKTYSNGWTNTSLDLLEALYNECKKKTIAYANAARESRKKHRMLSIPSLIIASAATATSFFAAGTTCGEENDDSEGLKVTVAMLTSVTAILAGIGALYSFDSKTTACIAASGSFDALAKKTQIQIYLTNELRGPVEVVINDVSAEFCHLTNTSPLL